MDNFTLRYEPFQESLDIFNEEINRRLNLVVQSLNNSKVPNCLEKNLMSKMAPLFLNEVRGKFETWMYANSYADVKRPALKDTIYFDFPFLYWADWALGSVRDLGKIGGLVKMNGVIFGTDKLGHFFDEGLNQYKIYQKSKSILEAIKYGQKTEAGIFGLYTTGVKSYADQVANFQGMSFWANLIEKGLHNNETPYLSCDRGLWKKEKDFDFSKYVDSGLDEGINCNDYKTTEIAQKISSRLQFLEENTGLKFTCPVSQIDLTSLQKKYSGDLKVLLNSIIH